MAELVLHVPDIDEAGKDYAFELAPAWLDVLLRDVTLRADPAAGPGALSVHVQQNGTEYLVTGHLSAQLITECGRCLADAKVPVDVEIGALFVRGAAAVAAKSQPKASESARRRPPRAREHGGGGAREPDDDVEEIEDGLQREPFSGSEIVLDDLVREHMVLEVPMQPLCSEQCEGIAVPEHLRPPPDVFREPGAVDPRLAPLQRLRDNVPQKSAPPARSADDAVRTGSAGPVGPGNQAAPEKTASDAKPKPDTASNKQSINLPNKANNDTDKE